ncbi:amino acid permease ScVBA-like protein [Mycena floridula]|nr:amino acid permease ScVBA-like protein [Mycena floridula]
MSLSIALQTQDNNTTTRPSIAIDNLEPDKNLPARLSSEKALSSSSSSTLAPGTDKYAQLSTFRLFAAHLGAALALFLATTDATIVSTALPTIASDLTANQAQYTWVGVSYMLTQTAFQPLYGRISDLVGRKRVLYTSITIFAIGSLLCGAARNITMLIASRALAGVGGGGIVSSVWVITSEIVPVQNRAKWSQALSITWSCSAVAGPLLGGLFSGTHDAKSILSWRWGFYLNLPVCLFAFIVLSLSLRGVELQRSSNASWNKLVHKFDFGGLIMFMAGTSCIVVGFSFAADQGWTSPFTVVLITTGPAILLCGGWYERRTTRESLFPAAAFEDLTVVGILVITFLHNLAFTAGTFFLALFYQAANGYTPLEAGVRMLPYSLGSSLASVPVAWLIGAWQNRTKDTRAQKYVISAGLFIATVGFGLLILLNERASTCTQILYPLVAGIGIGMLFHAPYQVFARALKPSELATGTSAFFLVRFTGATIGLAVAGAIFHARASTRLPANVPQGISGSSMNFTEINSIVPESLKLEVLRIISSSVQTVWMLCTPCLGVAGLVSLSLRTLPSEDVPLANEKTADGENVV